MHPQNILTIDDSSNSITYHKSKTDDSVYFGIALDELLEIFEKNPEEIFSYITNDSLKLIKSDNTEISLHQYQRGDIISFIKITNNDLAQTDNDILISCELSSGYLWHKNTDEEKYNAEWKERDDNIVHKYELDMSEDEKKLALIDIHGYQNCINVLSEKRHGNYTAIMACMKIKQTHNGMQYQGYLPAIGQLSVIFKCRDLINYILGYIGYNKYAFPLALIWSSTQVYKKGQKDDWTCAIDIKGGCHAINKIVINAIFPIFKRLTD